MSADDATHPPRPNAENMGSDANINRAPSGAAAHAVDPVPPARDTETIQKGEQEKVILPFADEATSTTSPIEKPLEKFANTQSAEDDLLTKTFRFLSTATPTTLSSVAVGLAAVTYFILGQIGLLLIGALGGIAFYIHWEASNPDFARAVHGESGVDVVTRLLGEKTDPKQVDAEKNIVEHDEERFLAHSFADFQPETREALNELVDAVIRDYVKWWYGPILPSDRSFPLSCRKVLTSFLVSIGNHLGKKRPADSFLDFLTNSSSMVIVFFSELSKAFSVLPPDSKMTAADAVYNYLASDPESTLAHLLSQRHQASKFKAAAEDLLDFLERPTYECDPARTFLREIMAGVILEMSLQSCSKAEWINGWIVYLLEAGEPDFNQAIDVGMQTGPDANAAVFADMDGNVGNIGIPKGSRNSVERSHSSLEQERMRRRDSSQIHKKKLSKADEEMENAMEEMKRMNQMILDAGRSRDSKETDSNSGVASPERLSQDPKDGSNSNGLNAPANRDSQALPKTPGASSPGLSGHLPPDQNPWADGRPSTDASKSPESTSPLGHPSPLQGQQSAFTSFEQLVPPAQDDSDLSDAESRRPAPLTLHNAKVTIYDDSTNDKAKIRAKPSWDYLIQIEPNSSHYSGWMIARQYGDFEKLHEVLRRIATISGITAFTEQHKELPQYKLHTRESLRGELERYVRDACWYKPLAESEGMKRFLDKDQGHTRTESKSGFQAVESFGKNVFGVLASAPKGVAEGGKVIAGGVTGVFGNMGLSRKSTQSSLPENAMNGHAKRPSTATPPPRMEGNIPLSGTRKPRDSLDSQRSSVVSTQPGKTAPMERRPSYQGDSDVEGVRKSLSDRWDGASPSAKSSRANSRASSMAALRSPLRSPSSLSLEALKLPPPPDAMPDDWSSPDSPRMTRSQDQILSPRTSADVDRSGKKNGGVFPVNRLKKQHSKMSEQETRVAVELVFAIINELYTLSSAWNFRRTLLAAAKSFLLRPGNPSLVSIQTMLQESVIEANSSDSGIAHHLRKMRENGLPTEEELKAWPPEPSMEEKEKLREKARRLLIESGVPAALTGVMGQNATSEALGRIFDCLQIEEVARGLLFGIMLQAVRVITH